MADKSKGEQFMTPGATGLRRTVESKSATFLVFLYQLPRWVLPVVLVLLMLAGLALGNWIGGVASVLLLGVVAWLAYLSWPSLALPSRLLRVALAGFTVVMAAFDFGLRF